MAAAAASQPPCGQQPQGPQTARHQPPALQHIDLHFDSMQRTGVGYVAVPSMYLYLYTTVDLPAFVAVTVLSIKDIHTCSHAAGSAIGGSRTTILPMWRACENCRSAVVTSANGKVSAWMGAAWPRDIMAAMRRNAACKTCTTCTARVHYKPSSASNLQVLCARLSLQSHVFTGLRCPCI